MKIGLSCDRFGMNFGLTCDRCGYIAGLLKPALTKDVQKFRMESSQVTENIQKRNFLILLQKEMKGEKMTLKKREIQWK